mmetsp:Transcript_35576/g.38540  ORF Transcript_35576/g.38540 Transcript_35576/m.38540 type:complete len:649 (+) Transcript_35576:156-2102(+)
MGHAQSRNETPDTRTPFCNGCIPPPFFHSSRNNIVRQVGPGDDALIQPLRAESPTSKSTPLHRLRNNSEEEKKTTGNILTEKKRKSRIKKLPSNRPEQRKLNESEKDSTHTQSQTKPEKINRKDATSLVESSTPILPIPKPLESSIPTLKKPPDDDWLSKIVAIDCGMVRVGKARKRGKKNRGKPAPNLALRRVCIVGGKGQILLDETVKVMPQSISSGYQTKLAQQVSVQFLPKINGCGDDLNVGVLPEAAKKTAAGILKGRIIVGHSVDGDLAVLGLHNHPRDLLRDTAKYRPFLNNNGHSQSLDKLVKARLGKSIQRPGEFHTCEEDARGALDLYLNVWETWESNMKKPASQSIKNRKSCNTDTVESQQVIVRFREEETAAKEKDRGCMIAVIQSTILLILLPGRVLSLSADVIKDCRRLFMEGIIAAWRVSRQRLGYVVSPPPFTTKQKQLGRIRGHLRYQRAKRTREFSRRCWRLLSSFEDMVLLANILYAPVSIFANKRNSGANITTTTDHWAIGISIIAASLFIASGRDGRQSPQSRVCFVSLAYYHVIKLCLSYNRKEWVVGDIIGIKEAFTWEIEAWKTQAFQDTVLYLFDLLSNGTQAILIHMKSIFETPSLFLIYHLASIVCFSFRWLISRRCLTSN